MSEGTVRRWGRMLKNWVEERLFTIKNEVVGRPSVVSEHLVQNIGEKIHERWRFKISEH
jgi:hypothetical protein